MKKYRRIEITAFQKRVTVVSGEWKADIPANDEILADEADSRETIEPESAEGRRILTEAVRLLEKKLANRGG